MKFQTIFTIAVVFMNLVAPLKAQNADQQLEILFQEYLEASFRMRPLSASQLGDHRFDHLLDDLSESSRKAWLDHSRRALRELPKRVDFSKLTPAGKIDFQIWKHELTTSIWLAENTAPFEDDPRTYNGYINDSIYILLTQSTLPHETNVANCILRMKQIPAAIAVAKSTLRNPPRQYTETALRQNRGAIGFYEKGIFEFAGPTPQLPKLKEAAAPIVTLLKDYQTFLENDLLPRSNGEWRAGKKRFAKKLELVLGAGFTADEVLKEAEAEFARVNRDLYVISRQIWSKYFPKHVLPPDDADGRRSTITAVLNAVAQEHGKPEDLVRDAKSTVEKIKTFITEKNILQLPNPDRCQVIEMPEFKRGNSIAYLDSAPPLDPKAGNFYAISPPPADWDAKKVKSYLEEYNRHMLQILTIHEAYPGHYVQLEYSNSAKSLIRRILQSGVFIEGWAVYTEQTMLDQGYGDGDLALRLSQLKFYLRAVANAILDHKMHCGRMTDEEAMKFLVEGAFQSEGEARLKVIRSKQSWVQLSTYFVGRMAHYRLRQEVQREAGSNFNLSLYHQAVLENGSIPPKFLPELVRARMNLQAVR